MCNKERDENIQSQIKSMGWNVLTIWDCEIQQKNNLEILVDKISRLLLEAISSQKQKGISIRFYEEKDDLIIMVAEDIIPYQRK
ncbi:MAG: very short patch repair endonuclease [Prevotellaceae bacterium]|jgi:DNA mismatch endonuclease (patch repair protein)|nr:very short patch repair endonuclease [Prevotellaceae bacterium]